MYANAQLWGLTLDRWPVVSWQLLEMATRDVEQPFRCPAVGTMTPQGPEVRTVILRHANPEDRRAMFYTDARSSKADQLGANLSLAWMFYDPLRQVQLRAWGSTCLHRNDPLADSCWDACGPANRRNYSASLVPGAPVDEPDDPGPGDEAEGRKNFLVVATEISRIDVLLLGTRFNRRLVMNWDRLKWNPGWLSP